MIPDRTAAHIRVARGDLRLLRDHLLALLPEGDPARARVSRALAEAEHQLGVAVDGVRSRLATIAEDASP